MEGKKFSSSKRVVIYVRDMLQDYQPDALRYFISAAGPENQDADFTWKEFVSRTNNELVAGWGNLVNRTAAMIAKNVGEIPPAGQLEQIDRDLLAAIDKGFETVGHQIETHHQRAAIAEAMRLVGEANRYVSETEPFKLKAPEQRDRLLTVLHVLAQAVTDLNTLLAPFLPFSANEVEKVLGGDQVIAPLPELQEVEDLDGGPAYPIITGEYSATPAWAHRPVVVGRPVAKPTPVFTKLDPKVAEEELAKLEAAG
jgi:methionyl-tRNA synthetase